MSLADASPASGSKYSVHQGDHCSGGGWDAVEGGIWRAYAQEKNGTKAQKFRDERYSVDEITKDHKYITNTFHMNLGGNHGYQSALSPCCPSPTCLTAIFRRPSHGATMRSIGHKSWSKAWQSFFLGQSFCVNFLMLILTIQVLHCHVFSGTSCPESWSGLKWVHGGTFYVKDGSSFCTGTRKTESEETSFSKLVAKKNCPLIAMHLLVSSLAGLFQSARFLCAH